MEMRAFRRHAAVVVSSLAVVTAMSATLAPTARADDQHGAIAVSPAHRVYGRALHASTKSAADAGAMSACGYSDCKVLVDFTNCGAVAENATMYMGGYGNTLTEAELAAVRNLGGGSGTIVAWGCN
ncbi:hypothetical protein A5791_03170 [Mycobacterium sp. 852002-51163_SCH5372311]|uniref:DUF4189 domain-containing protein n=1 Tax=Mycobacterium sp. 852002-51163_SCH5372311 TaxID=1834097 RepID=UPI000800B49E|nr:DUF4189 domain-containing protein [Mycobacterium sp. 852002-51163_SCH5372311]OBF83603.1 hypothetical protein A5791_03170 [Mycobacterium sp. 852002-51163_SCH5372311]